MMLVISHYMLYAVSIVMIMIILFFFSGVETALLTSDRIHLEDMSRTGSRSARRSLAILDNIENAIIMIQIAISILQISAASFVTYLATEAFSVDEPTLYLVVAVQTIVFLLMCELSPKIIARARAERFLMLSSYPVAFLMIVFRPLTAFGFAVSGTLKKIAHITDSGRTILKSRDEIDMLFKIGEQEGVIDEEHHVYVSEILSFRDITAREVMTPTIDIMSVELQQDIRDLIDIFARTRFSRIPVYEGRVDNLIGYVFYRDILTNRNCKRIQEVMNKVHYVPTTKKIVELYSEMLENLIPMVCVVNEYGAVVGMVTHEDIAEEIVGEIHSRDQSEEELISELGRERYLVSGKLDIEYFMKRFHVPIEKKGFETLSGFIASRMGKIPKKGDRFSYDSYTFTIEEATERSIDKVILQSIKKKRRVR
jgi:putative hemolysin